MTNWLSAGVQFDAVISNNDEMAIGAIQSLKAAGRSMDSVIIAGIDATQDALAAMAAGDLDVSVFQNAAGQGKGALDAALKLAKGDAVDKKVFVPFEPGDAGEPQELSGQELSHGLAQAASPLPGSAAGQAERAGAGGMAGSGDTE